MSSNPFEGDVSPHELARTLRSPRQIANHLTEELPGLEASSAEVLCDIVNVQRADVRMLGRVHGVEIETERMTEDRAATLIAGIVDGDGMKLVEVFNEIAEKRAKILEEALSEEQYQAFMEQKVEMMHTADPVTFEDDDRDDAYLEED